MRHSWMSSLVFGGLLAAGGFAQLDGPLPDDVVLPVAEGAPRCLPDCDVVDLGGACGPGGGLSLSARGALYAGGELTLTLDGALGDDCWLILSTSPSRSAERGCEILDVPTAMRSLPIAPGTGSSELVVPDAVLASFVPGGVLYVQAIDDLGVDVATSSVLEIRACDPLVMSRAEAIEVVREQVIAQHRAADVLMGFAFEQPLGPGQVVESAQPEFGGDGPLVVDTCSWFFYLDLEPGKGFLHETLFVLVSGTTADPVVRTARQLWWPSIDGAEVFVDPEQNEMSSAWFYGDVPLPDIAPDRKADNPPLVPQMACPMHAIMFQGPGTYDNDVKKHASKMFQNGAGIPLGNQSWRNLTIDNVTKSVGEANEACACCVMVYITAHGGNGKLDGLGPDDITADQLATELGKLKACSVWVIIQACGSGAFIQPIMDALKSRDEPLFAHEPATCVVMTSASADGCSLQHSGDCAGSYWTADLHKCWTDLDADANGDGMVDGLEAFQWAEDEGSDDGQAGDPQWGGQSQAECGSEKEPYGDPVEPAGTVIDK